MDHKTEPNALHDPSHLGDPVPGHRAGCGAIGISGDSTQPIYYLEDPACCDCGGIEVHVRLAIDVLKIALSRADSDE